MDRTSVFLVTGASRGLGREIVQAALAGGPRRGRRRAEPARARRPRRRGGAAGHGAARRDGPGGRRGGRPGRRWTVSAGWTCWSTTPGTRTWRASRTSIDDFRAQVDANLFGVVHLTRAALPEPGGMRTDWAGSSMRLDPVRPAYDATVGEMVRRYEKGGTTNPNDPAKVAQVVLQVAAMEAPPLRLLVGEDAFVYGTAVVRARLAEDERWEGLSRSTTADDATAEDIDPLRRAEACTRESGPECPRVAV